MRFMSDPENPLSGSPPPAPDEEWGALDGAEYLQHLSAATFQPFIQNKNVLVLFYAPCKYFDVQRPSTEGKTFS